MVRLIQWKPKSKTDIHSHNGKNVNLYLFNISLQEVRYKNKNI